MYNLDYDPGHIEGYIVIRKTIPMFEEYTVVSGSEIIDNDNSTWLGNQQHQVPKYDTYKILSGYATSWDIMTLEEYRQISHKFKRN